MPALQAGSPITDTDAAGATPRTVSVTVNPGSNRCLLVGVAGELNTSFRTTVTYGGVALRRLALQRATSFGLQEVWFMPAPPIGTANVVVTDNAATKKITGIYVVDDVDQNAPFRDVKAIFTDSATASSITLEDIASGDLLIDFLDIDNTGHADVAGAGQTNQYNIEAAAGSTTGVSSTQAGSAGGVMSHTWTTAQPASHIALALVSPRAAAVGVKRSAPSADTGGTAPAVKTATPTVPDSGATAISGGTTAWNPGAYVDLLPYGWGQDIGLVDLVFQVNQTLGTLTTRELMFEVAKGAPGSEVIIAQVPYSYRIESSVGYVLDNDDRIIFPEPIVVTSGTRLSVRVSDNTASAFAWANIKIRFIELASSATPINATDVNGTITELASLIAALAAADANGTVTEAVTLVAAATATDANGATSEAAALALSGFADASATIIEAVTLLAQIPAAESNGATSESAAIRQTTVDTNGVLTETGIISQVVQDSNGPVTETSSAGAPIAGSDANGATTEATALAAQVPGSDANGSSTEVASLAAQPVATDVNGSTSESAALIASASTSDSNGVTSETTKLGPSAADANGATSEGSSLTAQASAADANGTTAEVGIVRQTVTDVNGATAEVVTLTVQIPTPDTNGVTVEAFKIGVATTDVNGTVTETASIGNPLTSLDTGTVAEAASLVANETTADSNGSTAEVGAVKFLAPGVDANGPTTETAGLLALPLSTDTGSASESASVRVFVSAGDVSGAVTETALPPRTQLQALDGGFSSETSALAARITATDAGSVTEAWTLNIGMIYPEKITGMIKSVVPGRIDVGGIGRVAKVGLGRIAGSRRGRVL